MIITEELLHLFCVHVQGPTKLCTGTTAVNLADCRGQTVVHLPARVVQGEGEVSPVQGGEQAVEGGGPGHTNYIQDPR